jgi:hypothetical protein
MAFSSGCGPAAPAAEQKVVCRDQEQRRDGHHFAFQAAALHLGELAADSPAAFAARRITT